MRGQCNQNVRKQQQISAVLRIKFLFRILCLLRIFLYAQNVFKSVLCSLLRMR